MTSLRSIGVICRCTFASRRSLASAGRADPPTSTPPPGRATDPYELPLQSTLNHSRLDHPDAIEPHPKDVPRHEHEDLATLRARLVYQTRKRGTLETGLLFSTFATVDRLGKMDRPELEELDRLLTVPEWTLYYWCIGKQNPPPDSPWAKSQVLERLRQHSANKEGVVRAMPELVS